jgi:hypothetical protein
VLVIGDQFLEDVDLLLKVSDLLLIVRGVLLAGLYDLFDTLALDLDAVEVLVGSEELGLHHF